MRTAIVTLCVAILCFSGTLVAQDAPSEHVYLSGMAIPIKDLQVYSVAFEVRIHRFALEIPAGMSRINILGEDKVKAIYPGLKFYLHKDHPVLAHTYIGINGVHLSREYVGSGLGFWGGGRENSIIRGAGITGGIKVFMSKRVFMETGIGAFAGQKEYIIDNPFVIVPSQYEFTVRPRFVFRLGVAI